MNFPSRKRTHLLRFDYANPNNVYFITLCTYNRQAYFIDSELAKAIEGEIDYRVTCACEVAIFAYCIMPDHLHMLLKLKGQYGRTLQNWVSAFKRYTAREAHARFNIEKLWQKDFYEHVVRTEESLSQIAQYVVHNPVRKKMVKNWQDYSFSKINFSDF